LRTESKSDEALNDEYMELDENQIIINNNKISQILRDLNACFSHMRAQSLLKKIMLIVEDMTMNRTDLLYDIREELIPDI
jgi:hypothetical protein